MIGQLVPVVCKLFDLEIENSNAFLSENDFVAKVMDNLANLESHYSLFDDLSLPSAIEKRVSEILSGISNEKPEEKRSLQAEYLDIVNTNVNSLLSTPEDLLSIVYQTPQRKKPSVGGTNNYFSFNFDDLAPLGVLSEVIEDLCNEEIISTGLQKLFEFDTADLLEHPQWPQLVEKLDFWMSHNNNDFLSRYFELIAASYFRLLQAFPMGTMQQDDTLRLSVFLLERYTFKTETAHNKISKTENLICTNLFRLIVQTFTPVVRYWQGEIYDKLFLQLVRLLTQENTLYLFLQNEDIMNDFALLLKKVRPFVLFITATETHLVVTLNSQISSLLSTAQNDQIRLILSLFTVYKVVVQCISCFSSGSPTNSSGENKSRVFVPGTNKLFSCSSGNEIVFSQVIYHPHQVEESKVMESRVYSIIISLLTTTTTQLLFEDQVLLDDIVSFAFDLTSQQRSSQLLSLLLTQTNHTTVIEHVLTRILAHDSNMLTLLDDNALLSCINNQTSTSSNNNQKIITHLYITCLTRPSLNTTTALLFNQINMQEIVENNDFQLIRKLFETVMMTIPTSQAQQHQIAALIAVHDTQRCDGIIIIINTLIASHITLTHPHPRPISLTFSSFLRQIIFTASSRTCALDSSGDDTSQSDTVDIVWVCRQLLLTLSISNRNNQQDMQQEVIQALDGLEESIDLIHTRHDRVIACPPTTHTVDEMIVWDTLIHDSRIPHQPLQLLPASPSTASEAADSADNETIKQQAEELLMKYFLIDYPMLPQSLSPDRIKQALLQAQSAQWTKHVNWFYLSLLRSTMIHATGNGEEEIHALLDSAHSIQQTTIYTASDLLLIHRIMQCFQEGRWYQYYEHNAECSIITLSQVILSGWFMPFVSVDDAGLIAMSVLHESSRSWMILADCAVLILFARDTQEQQKQRWKGLETITHHMLISNRVWSLMELTAVMQELLQEAQVVQHLLKP